MGEFSSGSAAAKLAHQSGSQIEKSLGHASIKTTEAYIGIDQDLILR
jgi:hypothetical protein